MASVPPQCDICYENYDESSGRIPRTLKECGHSFCSVCLTELAKTSAHFLQCPKCSTKTQLGKDGVTGLPKAFALLDFMHDLEESEKEKKKKKEDEDVEMSSEGSEKGEKKKKKGKKGKKGKKEKTEPETESDSKTEPEKSPISISVVREKQEKPSALQDVLITINPPKGLKVSPVDVCCVIDVSGSMDGLATMKNEKGETESHGLSLLDIVKHAAKTVIESLHPADRLAVVVFATTAEVAFKLTEMDEKGKKSALKVVEDLRTLGSTNIWDGLRLGMDQLKSEEGGNLSSLMLFTDGLPNVDPPKPYVQMLQEYKDKHPDCSCIINMFGFGNSLDSALLDSLAVEGNGSFVFIPDSGFVGTVFVNAVSNLLVTWGNQLKISLEPRNGSKIVQVFGHPRQDASWGTTLQLGTLQMDQKKNVVIKMSIPPKVTDFLGVTVRFQRQGKAVSHSIDADIKSIATDYQLEIQRARLYACDLARLGLKEVKGNETTAKLKDVCLQNLKGAWGKEKQLLDFIIDIQGQVVLAFSDLYFNTWGKHFLRSLMRAHLLEQRNNFKDPGVQWYGGELFQTTQKTINDIFDKLPAPKSSAKSAPSYGSSYGGSSFSGFTYQASSTPISMSHYNNSSGVCFHETALVHMADGSLKKISLLKKGDKVLSDLQGKTESEVLCMTKTIISDEYPFVSFKEGLLVTPYHPVRISGKWYFPLDLTPAQLRPCKALYNLVLKSNHIIVVNNVECVTLGHNFEEPVVSHTYFGSNRIIEDLAKCPGWEHGMVKLKRGCFHRSSETGQIDGIKRD